MSRKLPMEREVRRATNSYSPFQTSCLNHVRAGNDDLDPAIDWRDYHRNGEGYSPNQLEAVFKGGFLHSIARQRGLTPAKKIDEKFFSALGAGMPQLVELGITFQRIKILEERLVLAKRPCSNEQRYLDAVEDALCSGCNLAIFAYLTANSQGRDPIAQLGPLAKAFAPLTQSLIAKGHHILKHRSLPAESASSVAK